MEWNYPKNWICIACLGCLSCQQGDEPKRRLQSRTFESLGATVAKVGPREIHVGELPQLSKMMHQLHQEFGVRSSEGSGIDDQLQQAIELVALAQVVDAEAGKALDVMEQQQRLLARFILSQVVSPEDSEPISDLQMQKAYQQEMERYQQTGESELYRPTKIYATGIVVGFFPDLHQPQPQEEAIVSREAALLLARQIYQTCGNRVEDLDKFYAVGRQFMAGHPTVRLDEFPELTLDPRWSAIPPAFHQALIALDGNGAVSKPIEFEGGVGILRRGVSVPGMGEEIEAIRPHLQQKIREARQKAAMENFLESIHKRFDIRIWPERLNRTAERPSTP